MLAHFLPSVFLIALSFPLFGWPVRRWSRRERRVVQTSYIAHVVSSFTLLWVMFEVYDGVSDTLTYVEFGEAIAAYVAQAPTERIGDLLSLIAQRPSRLPFNVIGAGTPTGSLAGIAGLLILVLRSGWAANLALSLLAFTGQLALYATFRHDLTRSERIPVAVGTLLVPSSVFWTSGIVKEAVAVAGLGWLLLGARALYTKDHHVVRAWLLALAGLSLVAISKPYLFMPLGVGLPTWWILARHQAVTGFVRAPRPGRWLLVGGAGWLVVLLVGQLLPQYSIDQLGEELAMQQYYGSRVGGGSYVDIGDSAQRSLSGQLAYAPIGLLAVLTRPWLFEARNPMMLVNAVETTLLLVLMMRSVVRLGPSKCWQTVASRPLLLAAAALVILAGTGVGLATTNLGTLSRYRVPIMPFYVLILSVWSVNASKFGMPIGTHRLRDTPNLRGSLNRDRH